MTKCSRDVKIKMKFLSLSNLDYLIWSKSVLSHVRIDVGKKMEMTICIFYTGKLDLSISHRILVNRGHAVKIPCFSLTEAGLINVKRSYSLSCRRLVRVFKPEFACVNRFKLLVAENKRWY